MQDSGHSLSSNEKTSKSIYIKNIYLIYYISKRKTFTFIQRGKKMKKNLLSGP